MKIKNCPYCGGVPIVQKKCSSEYGEYGGNAEKDDIIRCQTFSCLAYKRGLNVPAKTWNSKIYRDTVGQFMYWIEHKFV